MVLVDNVYGFTLYWISNGARVRRFQATTISGRPRAAAFGEYGGVVITSGNQGSAHVYDLTIKGETPAMQELRHADEGEVHHVAVSGLMSST